MHGDGVCEVHSSKERVMATCAHLVHLNKKSEEESALKNRGKILFLQKK